LLTEPGGAEVIYIETKAAGERFSGEKASTARFTQKLIERQGND
jgi:hypothetical protein